MVYASCRRTMDSKDVVLSSDLTKAIRAELGTATETGLTNKILGEWISEDEDSFENALLISELVSKNLNPVRPSQSAPKTEVRPATPAASAPKAHSRRNSQTAPGIADLLDDMLSQQRERR